jgi:single-strand DNA-binding protein
LNRVSIIGNLTKDPTLNTTPNGKSVCNFTVAVNRRRQQNAEHPEADFFRVAAWEKTGEACAKYLAKGRKVAVVGSVSVHTYTGNDGATRASLGVNADDVEFLSSRNEGEAGGYTAPAAPEAPSADSQAAGFTAVETDELPF